MYDYTGLYGYTSHGKPRPTDPDQTQTRGGAADSPTLATEETGLPISPDFGTKIPQVNNVESVQQREEIETKMSPTKVVGSSVSCVQHTETETRVSPAVAVGSGAGNFEIRTKVSPTKGAGNIQKMEFGKKITTNAECKESATIPNFQIVAKVGINDASTRRKSTPEEMYKQSQLRHLQEQGTHADGKSIVRPPFVKQAKIDEGIALKDKELRSLHQDSSKLQIVKRANSQPPESPMKPQIHTLSQRSLSQQPQPSFLHSPNQLQSYLLHLPNQPQPSSTATTGNRVYHQNLVDLQPGFETCKIQPYKAAEQPINNKLQTTSGVSLRKINSFHSHVSSA